MQSDPEQATTLLQSAWTDLGRAAATVDASRVNALRGQIAAGLDKLYQTFSVAATPVYSAPSGAGPERPRARAGWRRLCNRRPGSDAHRPR